VNTQATGLITRKTDNEAAREAAAREGERIDKEIRRLATAGLWGESEHLTLQRERADLGSETWGDCYLRLRGLAREVRDGAL